MEEKNKNSTIKALGIGITTLVLGGLLLGGLQRTIFKEKEPPIEKSEISKPIITIESNLVSRSVILDPNPGGLWASEPFPVI